MISAIIGFVSGIVGWLASVLPDSPFAGLFTGNQSILTGLGWLNWLLPVGDLLAIFGLFLAVLLIWAAVDFAISKATGAVTGVIGQ